MIMAPDDHGPRPDRRVASAVMFACVLGSSLAQIAASMAYVTLPAVEQAFGLGSVGMQWAVNAYLLPLSALVMLGGAIGDAFGRKRAFVAGLVIFAIGSAMATGVGAAWGRADQAPGSHLATRSPPRWHSPER